VSTGMVAKSDARVATTAAVKKRVQRRWISRNSSGVGGTLGDRRGARGAGGTIDAFFCGEVDTYVTILTVIFALLARSGGLGLNARSGRRRLRLFADLSFDQLGIDIEMAEVPGVLQHKVKQDSFERRGFLATPSRSRQAEVIEVMTLNDFGTLDSATPQRADERIEGVSGATYQRSPRDGRPNARGVA